MSEKIPTTKELSDNFIASFKSQYGQDISVLQKAFLRVVSKVLAGMIVIVYRYIGFLGLQPFVSTASSVATDINGKEIVPLVELGREYGLGDPALADAAVLEVTITVENQTGSLPSGTPLVGVKNGVTYITKSSVLLSSATVTVDIIAVSDQQGGDGSGTIGNLDVGDEVSFVNPLASVNQVTTVLQTVVTGAEGEDLDTEYRRRVDERRKNPPQGGALADYIIWGTEVVGIINIYPYTGDPAEVNVYSEATPQSSGNPDGIPTAAQLEAVFESIEFDAETGIASRRPDGAFVNSLPISRVSFDVKVFGLVVDDIALVRDEIEQGLEEYFLEAEPFIVGISSSPRKDRVTLTAVGGVIEDIVASFGGTFASAQLILSGSPITIFSLGEGVKAKLGGVTFI